MTLLFENCEIQEDRRELRREHTVVHVEPQVFDLLVYLVRHRDRVVSEDELIRSVWDGRFVSDDTVASRVSAARRAIGDSGAEQRFIRTVTRRGFRVVGEVRGAPNAGPTPTAVPSPAPPPFGLQQRVRFCQASDGAHLAVASAGVGMPLVKAANWLNHIEFDWQSPVWSPLFSRLAAHSANWCGMTSAAPVSPIVRSKISHLNRSSTTSKPWLTNADFTVSRCWASRKARRCRSRLPCDTPNVCHGSFCT